MGFTFVAAGQTSVVLSGSASRQPSVTGSFDRESLNSIEQTFTVVVVSFMVAPTDVTDITDVRRSEKYTPTRPQSPHDCAAAISSSVHSVRPFPHSSNSMSDCLHVGIERLQSISGGSPKCWRQWMSPPPAHRDGFFAPRTLTTAPRPFRRIDQLTPFLNVGHASGLAMRTLAKLGPRESTSACFRILNPRF